MVPGAVVKMIVAVAVLIMTCRLTASTDVLLIVAHRTDKGDITRIIKEIDPKAFITISKTASVFGKNFDNIKI